MEGQGLLIRVVGNPSKKLFMAGSTENVVRFTGACNTQSLFRTEVLDDLVHREITSNRES